MATSETLYAELKPDIGIIASQLFELSEKLLRENGNFLPHGAVLTEEGEVRLVAAAPRSTDELTNSTEVLPLLHEGLRYQAKERSLRAVGVAENVTVTQEGQRPTEAIKVLFEHRLGLTVALYLPFQKKLFRGYVNGLTFFHLGHAGSQRLGGKCCLTGRLTRTHNCRRRLRRKGCGPVAFNVRARWR